MTAPNRPLDNNGSIIIRFTHRGFRFCMGKLGLYEDGIALQRAQIICDRIKLDISSGNFLCENNEELIARYNPLAIPIVVKKPKVKYLLDLWDKWVDTLNLSPRTLNNHYRYIRRQIEKSNPKVNEVDWFVDCQLSAQAFNSRLTYLKSCLKWGVSEDLVDSNPFEKVSNRKVRTKAVKPFNQTEIKLIINAFRTDQFSPKKANNPHSFYADYIEFLFMTGVRPSEAIGLQVKHLDFNRGLIEISSVLARSDDGDTCGSKRVRKETKTGGVRILEMNPRLKEMLLARCVNKLPKDLVFPSPTGLPIDDHNFLRRQWQPVLEGLGIEYRRPYITRHTLASIALEKGVPITGVSYLLGHSNTEMVSRTYGHMINRPKLPDLD